MIRVDRKPGDITHKSQKGTAMSWLYLALAVLAETVGTTFMNVMKLAQGRTKLLPIRPVILFMP